MGESDEENETLSSPASDSDDGGIRKEVKKPKKPKRVASRFFNALLALVFFVLFVLSLVSFSAFSNNYRKIQDQATSGTCILDADSTTQLGSDGTCRLAIGGEVVIAVYAFVSIAVMIIKICGGWSMISCFLIFELIAVIVMILLSFSTCVVISVGRSLTCRNVKAETTSGNCADAHVGNVYFYKDLQVAEVSAWLGFGVLFCITIFYIICVIMYCYGKRQARVARKEAYQRAIDDRKREEKEEKREKD